MQVILMEKVTNLGNLGDVVKVKDGYARNFLIPGGHAKRATKANVEAFEVQRAELEKNQADRLAAAQARAEKLEGLMIQITQRAGVDGRLFGSVGNSDIAQALTAQGIAVTRAEVRMPTGHFKAVGDYDVSLVLHPDVTVGIKVSVLGETA
jgi:large subunit ribosomal protein L9